MGRICADEGDGDEDAAREYWLAFIRFACSQALQSLNTLAQEQEILTMMVQRQGEDISSTLSTAEGAS